jgi:hypothetical protein
MLAADGEVMLHPCNRAGLNLARMACLAACRSQQQASRKESGYRRFKFHGFYSVT